MRDAIMKLRLLWSGFLLQSFQEWRTEIWERDLDSRWCCDGRECGCQGMTIREVFGPPLAFGQDCQGPGPH